MAVIIADGCVLLTGVHVGERIIINSSARSIVPKYNPNMLGRNTRTLLLLLCSRLVYSHTWVEQLANIAPNGTLFRFGYPRSFVDKGVAGFLQSANEWQLPPSGQPSIFVGREDLICHPSQRTPTQLPGYPRLQALPGSIIAMRYAENGHVTLPGGGSNLAGKPEKGGTVFVFGTQEPRNDERLANVLQWTRDGLGGDRRGLLLAAQNFDDGRCYQLGKKSALAEARQAQMPNPVAGQPDSEHELLCETDVTLPESVAIGMPLSLYWVWQWPTAAKTGPYRSGKDEYYISCADVDIVASLPSDHVSQLLVQQDPNSEAVPDFRSRGALTNDPLALSSLSGFGLNGMQQTQSAASSRITART
jgi:hypothetical protein